MQNKENTTFFALLRQPFALERIQYDLKHHLKHIRGVFKSNGTGSINVLFDK